MNQEPNEKMIPEEWPEVPDDQPPTEEELAAVAEKGRRQVDSSSEVAALRAKADEANQRYLRSLADFQNYQKRAMQNEQVARQSGIAAVVQNVASVLDHFDMALSHDPSKASAAQVMEGVRVIREELIKALQMTGVAVVAPKPNDEFKPGIHEAIMQQDAKGVEPGRIVATFQPGYTLGERVIRAAKVSVAPSD